MKKIFIFIAIFCSIILLNKKLIAQCSAPSVSYPNCAVSGVSGYSNCHGFAWKYLEEGYNLGYVNCDYPSASDVAALNTAAQAGFQQGITFIDQKLEPGSIADHDVVTYMYNGLPTHSAINLKYQGYYISKWEDCGPVVKHYRESIGLPYYDPGNANYSLAYWKKKDVPQCITPSLTMSACTSCSCTNYQGDFLVSGGTAGWSGHTWSVSGASISYNAGSYIYIDKPGGGYVGVTLTATYIDCNETKSKYQSYIFPNCSSGAYQYLVSDSENLLINNSDQKIRLVLPKELYQHNQNNSLELKIYNLNGSLVKEQRFNQNKNYVELKTKPITGVYILHILKGDERILSKKIYFK